MTYIIKHTQKQKLKRLKQELFQNIILLINGTKNIFFPHSNGLSCTHATLEMTDPGKGGRSSSDQMT